MGKRKRTAHTMLSTVFFARVTRVRSNELTIAENKMTSGNNAKSSNVTEVMALIRPIPNPAKSSGATD